MEAEPARAVISYAHGPDDERIVALADRLNHEGVDCEIDAYDQEPAEGWGRWMTTHMSDRTVIVVCSEAYYRRFRLQEAPGVGLGATFESGLLVQRVLESQGRNEGVIPVLLRAADAPFIPEFLRDVTRYDLSSEAGYQSLYRRLTGQPARRKPPLGEVRRMETSVGGRAAAQSSSSQQVVLVYGVGLGMCAIPFQEIERVGESISVKLAPQSDEDASFAARMLKHTNAFAVAFGSDAAWVKVRGGKESLKAQPIIEVQLHDETPRPSAISEASYNGISADDLARMRARRILLDEKLPVASGGSTLSMLNDTTLELFVRGPVGYGKVLEATESPLPALARAVTSFDAEFFEIARLLLVMYLRLTNTVEHIVSLRLGVLSEDELVVEFAGIRARAYANRDPTRIEVSGTCRLGAGRSTEP